jgi:hypothetical protein
MTDLIKDDFKCKERVRYQASWGAWYVSIDVPWGVVELKFDKNPDEKMLAVAVGKLEPPPPEPEPVSELAKALDFIEIEYERVKALDVKELLDDEKRLKKMLTKEASVEEVRK